MKERWSRPGYEYSGALYVLDNERQYNDACGGFDGRPVYRRADEEEIRNGFQELGERKAEEARKLRMTDAEKDLEVIKAAGAVNDFKKGNDIIRDRNLWKQGGSMFDTAEYIYWDKTRLTWNDRLNPGYSPYWG
jgi:hypothetical protein